MNIILTVNEDFFLSMNQDAVAMEGEDINVTFVIPDGLGYSQQLDYRNGHFCDRVFVEDNVIIAEPYNQRGLLVLQLLFQTETMGLRKTNTVAIQVHKSVNAGCADRDMEEVLEMIRELQNKVVDLQNQINEITGGETGLSERVDALEKLTATHTTDIGNLQETMQTLQAAVTILQQNSITSVTQSQGIVTFANDNGTVATLDLSGLMVSITWNGSEWDVLSYGQTVTHMDIPPYLVE